MCRYFSTFQMTKTVAYLWCESHVVIHKPRVRVILNVLSLDEVLQMIQRPVRTVYKLYHRHLEDVHLQQTCNNLLVVNCISLIIAQRWNTILFPRYKLTEILLTKSLIKTLLKSTIKQTYLVS